MTTRIVLISAPVSLEERYGSLIGAASTQPSFGLVCLGSSAKKAGADVTLIEASAFNLGVDESLAQITRIKPDIVGISSTTVGIVKSGQLALKIKQVLPNTLTVIGGCHATALPEETLAEFPGFDMAVIGEGEATLVELICKYPSGIKAMHDIPGTASRRDGRIVKAQARSPITSLDELPLPDWSLLPGFPKAYRPSPARIKRMPCASVVFTRGCPNCCTFCDRSVFGRNCRAYSPAYAVEMVKQLRNDHGVREINIEDDTFIISKQRVEEFCRRIIDEKIDITWSCLGRADRADPEMLKLMKQAGCWHISFGIESGDPRILKLVNKNLDLQQIKQAVKNARNAGMRTKGFFMVGFPEETPASIKATIDFVRDIKLDDISVMQLTPFPGSELYETSAKYGTFDRDWRKMNAVNSVFVPTGLTRSDLDSARSAILSAFYSKPSVLYSQLRHVLANPRLIPYFAKASLSLIRIISDKRGAS